MSWFKTIFTYFPFLVWALTMFTYVMPCRYGTRVQAIWAMALLACAAKFLCFEAFGGDAFVPELPAGLIWAWNVAYSSAMLLFVLSAVWSAATWVVRRFVEPSPRTRTLRRWALPLAALALAGVGVWNGIKDPSVKEVELAFADLPPTLDGYRICQLADLHVSSAARRDRTERVVAAANAAKADLIVCTGDIVDGLARRRHHDVEPIKDLRAPDGVWFVTGNHEYYNDWLEWRTWYDRWGIRFLSNTCVFPRPELALGGVNDGGAEKLETGSSDDLPDIDRTFASATNGEFRILLEHRPSEDPKLPTPSARVDLKLSGHTHGGVMPVLSALVAVHNRGFVRGVYDRHDWVDRLYVSPGCGQWAGFPVRLFNDPEITVITLRRASEAAK